MWPFKKIRINACDRKEREIRFLGIPIFQYGYRKFDGFKESYLKIFPKSFEHAFLDKIIQEIGHKYDFVLLIRTKGIGETYLSCLFWRELVQEHKAKSPCIVFHRRELKNIIRLFDCNTPLYLTENLTYRDYSYALIHNNIKYKKIEFCTWQFVLADARKMAKIYLRDCTIPYKEYVRIRQNLKDSEFLSPHFSEEDLSVTNLVHDLDVNNFVFVITDANSTRSLPKEFWRRLCDRLREKGMDVFVNTKNGVSEYGKSTPISIGQAVYLASKSQAIISIRCGLVELLSSFPVQKHIVYTQWMWEAIPPEKVLKVYSLSSYPGVHPETLHEYAWQDDTDALISRIVGTL